MPENRSQPLAVAWGRDNWLALADRLLNSVRPFASPGQARIMIPGRRGGSGAAVDGLEGFARSFLLAGFRIAGDGGRGLEELAERYAIGVAAGTDPASPERWVRLDEHPQAKVEAASIALVLDMTRPWIWDRLAADVQQRVVEYLAPAVGDPTYPQINWVWFRLVVQTFLRSVGGPWSAGEMAEDLATHDTFRRAAGWMTDGPDRAYDHYGGWALHLFPVLWSRMAGAADLAAGRREHDVAMLDRYLLDAVTLVGADGSPLLQGRSLIYRFAAAAPFWAGALAGVPSVSPGRLRHAATRIVRHFLEHGVPDERGLLTIGWHGPWQRLAQSYSGPGSPYWASKGLLGIALPADHPVWLAPAEPLPVESGDVLRAISAPGWLVSGTRDDGIVRVINHGTDHAQEGAESADSPLYARLGYSTATAPVLDECGWTASADQSVALVDRAGRSSHRTGMRTLTVRVDGDGPQRVAVAGSVATAHWVELGEPAADHGSGRVGTAHQAGRITTYSIVRGAWEVRLIHIDEPDPAAVQLRITGWAVAGEGPLTTQGPAAAVTGIGRTSVLAEVAGDGIGVGGTTAGVAVHDDAGPLGSPVRVPWLERPVPDEATWVAAIVGLTAAGAATGAPTCRADLAPAADGWELRVRWPDGAQTRSRIENTSTGSTIRATMKE